MNAASVPPSQPSTPSAAMIRTLGLVATVCGILIVTAYEGTLEAVAANKKLALERAVFKVIPGASSVKEFVVGPTGVQPAGNGVPEGAVKLYAAYDQAGSLKGLAAEGAAKGYSDTVRVLYAYDPEKQAITGIGVVSMRETPGIGDKIYTDAAFLKNFEALDVTLSADLKSLANAVKVVKHGGKQNPWEIDAIAGATVTCKAVGKGINESAQKLLPLLLPHLDKLKAGEPARPTPHPAASPPLSKRGQGGFDSGSASSQRLNPPQPPFEKGGSRASHAEGAAS
ncbi:MAG: FMN-binding protein [Pseudomonadota bacterium]|nr:FMN-binding protein [Pseudomonadota bacterium]